MPITSQEATQEIEGVLEIDNDHISDSVAKESQVDDTVIIKKSIESGESVPRAHDVRNFDLSQKWNTFYFHFINIHKKPYNIEFGTGDW